MIKQYKNTLRMQ